MSKSPAYPMYAQDFDMDTAGWTVQQVGVYIRLLNYEWINGTLPNNISALARIARIDSRNMQKMWSRELAKKFLTDDANMLVNKRMEEEREKQDKYRETRVENGSSGARKRWGKSIAHGIAQPLAEPEHSDSSSSSSSIIKNKTTPNVEILPSDIDPETWEDFKEMRKKIRAPLTKKAMSLIFSELVKIGQNKNEVLQQSILNSWRGVFALKNKNTVLPEEDDPISRWKRKNGYVQ